MYKDSDLVEIKKQLSKRWRIVCIPAGLLLALAIGVFVYGQLNRSETLWMVTVALTLLGGGMFVFFFGVYIKPMLLYKKHVNYMLNGKKRETTGLFKSFAEDICDKEGLDCYMMFVNVGERDLPEDDRLFYYDAHKPKPEFEIGKRITVVSNDTMVADITAA